MYYVWKEMERLKRERTLGNDNHWCLGDMLENVQVYGLAL
jgi:hypothetical protein